MPENLKNVLLFMSSSGYLVPPRKDPSQEKLWIETWKRIDRFLPDLRGDLQLEEPEPEPEPKGASGLEPEDPLATNPATQPRSPKAPGEEERKVKETATNIHIDNKGEEELDDETEAKQ